MADFNSSDLDDVIHGRMRLGLIAYLAGVESASFAELKERTGATDGNLSTHLRKLEDTGYVAITKRFVDRRPRTDASLTALGRKAWIAYLDDLKKLVGE
ncbi:MAG: transcriptional regulator [Oceanicaulis sp.]|uniref:winged helix-turn-helix domain-containing protein n=1 Tax=Glycocaulis sp. TaxID=1969725 RepID=UPI0025C520EE|nr:transcriptional regulator [Glycocaulis sp.]MCC5981409.1 transcriptional regulator [Oceanicaulis sp.]MCH8521765.1 transcriptional regulator [Glycocaulis sp.]